MNAQYWIEKLKLEKHPEGGYFREMYRSTNAIPQSVLGKDFSGDRSFCTSIYFLLEGHEFSAFHRIYSDELWHYHTGGEVNIYILGSDGSLSTQTLGHEGFQAIIPANSWFAAELIDQDSFVLAGCTVSPGFDFHDFELAKSETLLKEFPQHKALVERMCIR